MELVQDKEVKKEELIKRFEIKDTPFFVIKTKEGYFGVVGNYRITEVETTKKKIVDDLKNITWNRLVQVMLILIEKQK